MLSAKVLILLGVFLHFSLARPSEPTDITVHNQPHSPPSDSTTSQLVRRKRFVFSALGALNSLGSFGSLRSYPLQQLGVRGDWRHCRTTQEGGQIFTNGIDVVCQGFCVDREVTCNDYYRPYFYNYFE